VQFPPRRPMRLLLRDLEHPPISASRRRLDGDYQLLAEIVSGSTCISRAGGQRTTCAASSRSATTSRQVRSCCSRMLRQRAAGVPLRPHPRSAQLGRSAGSRSPPSPGPGRFKLPGTTSRFPAVDPRPYLGTFQSGKFQFMLGERRPILRLRAGKRQGARILETYAVPGGRKSQNDEYSYGAGNTIPLGDSTAESVKGDPVYEHARAAARDSPHTSTDRLVDRVDSHYGPDCVFRVTRRKERFTGPMNVFDFRQALFVNLLRRSGLQAVPRLRPRPHSDHRAALGRSPTTLTTGPLSRDELFCRNRREYAPIRRVELEAHDGNGGRRAAGTQNAPHSVARRLDADVAASWRTKRASARSLPLASRARSRSRSARPHLTPQRRP